MKRRKFAINSPGVVYWPVPLTVTYEPLPKDRSAENATIRRMAAAGYTDSEIGQHIGRDRQYVGRRRRELRIQPGQPPRFRAMVARLHLRRLCGRVAA